jgi:hypothetical protein
VVLVTHSGPLVQALREHALLLELTRTGGVTQVAGGLPSGAAPWQWPRR